jgi:ribosome-binding protein aMBF1 (putative translation factor)
MEIAIGVRKARELRDHSQRELSRMIGANASYVNRLESGTLTPSLPMLLVIAWELEVPLVQIVEWSMTDSETKYLQNFRDKQRACIAKAKG